MTKKPVSKGPTFLETFDPETDVTKHFEIICKGWMPLYRQNCKEYLKITGINKGKVMKDQINMMEIIFRHEIEGIADAANLADYIRQINRITKLLQLQINPEYYSNRRRFQFIGRRYIGGRYRSYHVQFFLETLNDIDIISLMSSIEYSDVVLHSMLVDSKRKAWNKRTAKGFIDELIFRFDEHGYYILPPLTVEYLNDGLTLAIDLHDMDID